MDTLAVILDAPRRIGLRPLTLAPLGATDVLVEIAWSGVSAGTEKLLWSGQMPAFPGMGYPLVPGYESVGRVVDAGRDAQSRIGEWVFVPGANCYEGARSLFGGTARRVILPAHRALAVAESLGRDGILMALAATAHHAVAGGDTPELIIGHGVLGRLIARMTMARGGAAPTVWETNAARRDGVGYRVIAPEEDERRDYRTIVDASGAADIVDTLVGHLAKQGEIVLAGFYTHIAFRFPPAFMREARLRISAEFAPEDLARTRALIDVGALRLGGLISHVRPATEAVEAYPAAFEDGDCRKMILDWRGV